MDPHVAIASDTGPLLVDGAIWNPVQRTLQKVSNWLTRDFSEAVEHHRQCEIYEHVNAQNQVD